ncbi:MAG: S-layer homology domain-containing protein [Clostridia bacterium]|nr:S-layer homology domain-containing protein [Clostridia bacterium]
MKKIISIILTAILTLAIAVPSFASTSYGSEWDGYYQVAPTKFSDVTSSHWAYNAVMQVYQKNWFKGYPDGSFRPNASITRAEALKVFVMFLGLDYQSVDVSDLTYSDISADDWYAAYVEAGKDLFPVHTTIQGKTPFNPNMPVTREDTIYALVKALGCDVDVKYPDQSVLNMFKDANSISGNIKAIFSIALMHELVSGFPDGTIRAQAALTRAEFATLLLRGTEHGFHDKYVAKISKVSVVPSTNTEMTIGETVTLSARATYTDGTNRAYEELSPYDANGNGVIELKGTKITAVKEGTAVIKYNDSYLKNETLTIVVKKPTDAPTLKITDYDEVTEESSMKIKGVVTDKNGSVDLTCNGKDVVVEKDGSFVTNVSLSVGDNNINFVATNKYGIETTKTIVIEREEAEPEPVVTPSVPEEKPQNSGSQNPPKYVEEEAGKCVFGGMRTELDTSWGDDEYFIYYSYYCNVPTAGYGIKIWDSATGKEIEYLDPDYREKALEANVTGTYSGCQGSIYDGEAYNLELGKTYEWIGYVVDVDGNVYESEKQTFVFDGAGSRFLP